MYLIIYQEFCFTSFWIVSLTSFVSKPESSRELTRFIMSSISSFDIISAAVPEPKIFLCIPMSAPDAASVNRNGIKTILTNDWSTFFFNGTPVFCNGPRSLPRNLSKCIVSDSYVFDSLILTENLFAKSLWRFASCLLVNNKLCGKLISPSELLIIFDVNLKTFPV